MTTLEITITCKYDIMDGEKAQEPNGLLEALLPFGVYDLDIEVGEST